MSSDATFSCRELLNAYGWRDTTSAPIFVAAVLLHVNIIVQFAVGGAVSVAALHVASRRARIGG